MTTLASLVVKLGLDDGDLDSGLGGAARKVDAFGSKIGDAGKTMMKVGAAATIGMTLPILAAGKAVFDAASDMNESMSKVDVVFGRNSQEIKNWAENAAQDMGMSANKALEAAGTFGNLFRSMGIGLDASTSMSKGIVQLASDLASFNNANPDDVLLALRSGLVGETEPLRQFGVNINEAALKTKALELGLIDNVKASNTHTKAMKESAARAEAVANAQRNVGDAVQSAADRSDAAAKSVASAQRAMGDAVMSAADRAASATRAVADANRGARDAEERLRDAQRDAKTAQDALTDARAAAAASLADLGTRVEEGAVRQKRATLRLQDAEAALAAARAGDDARKVTDAELDLEQARLDLTTAARTSARDEAELAKRRKAGIDGSEEVVAAQERIVAANRTVAGSERSVADAHQAVADAEKDRQRAAADSARSIGDAYQAVADAGKNQERALADNARSVADAQRGVAKAMESGIKVVSDLSDEMTPAIKAQAAYAIIMEQTKLAQGDFARTADGAANKQRILTAQFQDAMVVLGQQLLPIGQKVLEWISGLITQFAALSPETQKWIMIGAGLLAVVGPLVAVLGALATAVGFLLSPIGLVIIAIAAVIAAGYLLYKHWDEVKAFASSVWDSISGAVGRGIDSVVSWFQGLPERIGSILTQIPGILGTMVGNLIVFFATLPATLGELLVTAGIAVFNGLIRGIAIAAPFLWQFFQKLPGTLWDMLGGGAELLIGVGKNLVIGLWNGLVSMGPWIWQKIQEFFKGMLGPIGKALGIGSPSKITAQYGRWVVEGLSLGMLDEQNSLANVADRIASTALPNIGDAAAGGMGGGGAAAASMAGVGGSSAEVVLEVDGYRLGKVLVPGVRAGLADVERRNVSTSTS